METVGSIFYDARITTKDFYRDADNVERRAEGVAGNLEKSGRRGFAGFAKDAGGAFDSISSGLGRILKSALLVGTSGSVGIGAMVKASWDQVSAVQQATVALGAYEKNGGKVNKVLSDLVAYARSDLGVLFNRKDLFAAAQSLRIMGDDTESLTDHVKIMSRSVGLGLSTWDDLSQIIGRVGSTGRLAGDDFDNLTKAGFALDDSLRNTDITFADLFKHLDKGIPADAMEGQADTIVGMGVRMQTAFRNIGDAILGVDADTGKFIKGGLGSRLVTLMGTLTMMMKDPAIKKGFADMGRAIGTFAETALPALIKGFTWIANNFNTVVALFGALTIAFVAAKLAAIGFGVAQMVALSPAYLIAAAVVAIIGVLAFLVIRFEVVRDVIRSVFGWIKSSWPLLLGILTGPIGLAVQFIINNFDRLKSVVSSTWKFITNVFKNVGSAIGNAVGNSFKIAINGILGFIERTVNHVIDVINNAIHAVDNITPGGLSRVGRISVPRMAEGGIVKATPGGILANIGEGGKDEAVIPLDKLDAMVKNSSDSAPNVTISINMSGIMARSKSDERDIAKSFIKRINEELQAKGQPILGGGSI